jgi:hypothetical protein
MSMLTRRIALSLRRLWTSRVALKPPPLGRESQALLTRLTSGLADPNARRGRFGLVGLEVGDVAASAPTLAVERLGRDSYLIARYVELVGIRSEDPDVNDRVADPEVEFLCERGEWRAVRARSGLSPSDPHDAALAVLRFAEPLLGLVEAERSAPPLADILRNRRQA